MSAQQRVALVTGGSRGIGLGICECLAREGFAVVFCGTRPADQVAEVTAHLRSLGPASYCRADVGVAADRQALLAHVRQEFGTLHVLVNNAGIAPRVRLDILEATEASYEEVMRINLQGPYFLTQAAARWMIEQQQADSQFAGCVINVSSISAIVASPSRGEYCLSKAGLSMATALFAVRLGEYAIPVYEIRPGITRTDMTSAVQEKYDRLIAEGLLLQSRWGTPEDVGRAAAALARGDLGYSTGQILNVDGGLMVQRL